MGKKLKYSREPMYRSRRFIASAIGIVGLTCGVPAGFVAGAGRAVSSSDASPANQAPVVVNPGPQSSLDNADYAQVVSSDGPVAYWRLGETSGAVARDDAGGYSGSILGGVTLGHTGALASGNAAMRFDGSSGYVRVPNSAALQLTGDLTIELWLNVSLATRQTLVSKDSLREFEFTLETSGQLVLYQGNGVTLGGVASAPGVIAANTWQHVVVTRTAATKTIAFYVNGVHAGGGVYGTTPVAGTKAVVLGRSDNGNGVRHVNGALDEIAIYSAVLSQSQLASHHALRSSTTPAPAIALQINASDIDQDVLSYGAAGLPAGLSLNTASGLISGTLSSASVGTYTVTVSASDGSLSHSQTFMWAIGHVNRAPVLATPPNQTNAEGDVVSVALSAVDADGDALVYSATGLPASLSLDSASGVISGALSFSSAGIHTVAASASDGRTMRRHTFTWTVTPTNRPPALSDPGPQTNSDGSDYLQLVLAAGPAGYWRLSDTAGAEAADSAGSNTGTRFGGVTIGQPGALADGSAAMRFDGSTGYVRVQSAPALQLAGDLTIEMWINVSLATRQTLISKSAAREFELTLETSGMLNLYQGNGAASSNVRSANGVIQANTWQHVVVTRTASSKTVAFYVNGVFNSSGTYLTAPATGTNPIAIGRSDAGGGIQYVNGRLDDVAVYPGVLGAVQVAMHFAQRTAYSQVVPSEGAAAYWRLGESSGATAADSAGSNPALIVGGVTLAQPGALGDGTPSMRFDGASSFLHVSNPAALQLSGNLTIEMWVNLSLASRQTLVSKDSSREFELTLETSGRLNLYQGNGSTVENVLSANGSIAANTWQHVVVTRAAASKTIAFYVNGAAKGSATYVTPPTNGTKPIVIGRSATDGGVRYVTGRLDEIALYQTALTPAQVAAHYALRTAAASGTPVALQLSASDPDVDGLTFSATGLPPTLSVNPVTGLISGTLTPASAGVHVVTATVTDGSLSHSQTFPWTVTTTVPVAALTLTADRPAPQPAGTSVTFTANPTGGVAPLQFKWLTYSSATGWTVARNWSPSAVFTWTPTVADAAAQVTVWARSAWNLANAAEKSADLGYPVVAPSAVLNLSSLDSVDLGQPVTWNAIPGADAYRLYFGTSPGANDLLDSGQLAAGQTSFNASVLVDRDLTTSVAWDFEGSQFEIEGFALRLDGERTDFGNLQADVCANPQPDRSCYRVRLPPMSSGAHTVAVSAYNSAGESIAAPISTSLTDPTIYARLWTRVNGVWGYTDSSFLAAPRTAQFVYPFPGSVRVDPTRAIAWNAVPLAEAYSLTIGRTPGSAGLVNAPDLQVTQYLAETLPGNETLYARLGTRVGGVWRYADASFVVEGAAAHLLQPTDGATGVGISQVFWWRTVTGAEAYRLIVGTTPGADNVIDTGEQIQYLFAAPTLPATTTFYARLWTKRNGTWRFVDSAFRTGAAWTPGPIGEPDGEAVARLVYPRNGETVTGATTQFRWTAVAGAARYQLRIGTSPGANDIAQSPDDLSATEYTVTGLPTDTTLYVRLYTQQSIGNMSVYVDATTMVRTTTPLCPCSLWSPTATPTNAGEADSAAVTLGIKFQSERGGFITGIRFYKSVANTGPHVGGLWTLAGTLLGSLTFASESAAGWQTATFAAPIAITAGTTYTASYHAPQGRYAEDNWYFATAFAQSPLGVAAIGSVHKYGTAHAFPDQTFKASNYWVDVIFADAAQVQAPAVSPGGGE